MRIIVSAETEIGDYSAALHEKSCGTPGWAVGVLQNECHCGDEQRNEAEECMPQPLIYAIA